jgi:hypothetical protein
MERGLLWLPLLIFFIGLTWAGWNEYQKLETYRIWAQQFDRAKYDIYAVLGQKDDRLTWGKPTRRGPIDLQTFSLKDVQQIQMVVGDRAIDLEGPPTQGKAIALTFQLPDQMIRIPFTEIPLAVQWGKTLEADWQTNYNSRN